MNTESLRHKKTIIDLGKRLYSKGFSEGTSGNISILFNDGCLVTCSGTNLGNLGMDDIVYISFNQKGKVRYINKPTSELFMHIALYRKRPDIKAIVHAHPIYCSAFGIARVSLNPALMPEVYLQFGEIPIVEYAMPSTEELAYKIASEAGNTNGLLMANHGAVTLGKDLNDAYYKMETLEGYAKIVYLAKQLGRVTHISEEEMEKLKVVRENILRA